MPVSPGSRLWIIGGIVVSAGLALGGIGYGLRSLGKAPEQKPETPIEASTVVDDRSKREALLREELAKGENEQAALNQKLSELTAKNDELQSQIQALRSELESKNRERTVLTGDDR